MRELNESQKKIIESKEYPFSQDEAFNLISEFLDENDSISRLETLSEKSLSVQIKDGNMNFGFYDPNSYVQSTTILIKNEKGGNDYYILSDQDILKAAVRYFIPKVVQGAESTINAIAAKELNDIDYRGRGKFTEIQIADHNVRVFVMGKSHHQDGQKCYYITDFNEDIHEKNLRNYFQENISVSEFDYYIDSKVEVNPLHSDELDAFNSINKKKLIVNNSINKKKKSTVKP